MNIDEVLKMIDRMREVGVVQFRAEFGDNDIQSVHVAIDPLAKRAKKLDSPPKGSKDTEPKKSVVDQEKTFEGLDVDTLLHSA
jgi:hypothetical protein